MTTYAEFVKRGLDYAKQVKSGVDAIKLDSIVENARDEQNLKISKANSFRTDALPENGKLHYIDALGANKAIKADSSIDPMEAARAEQTARIVANNQ